MLFLANLLNDFDRILAHWISEEKWSEALDVMSYHVILREIVGEFRLFVPDDLFLLIGSSRLVLPVLALADSARPRGNRECLDQAPKFESQIAHTCSPEV